MDRVIEKKGRTPTQWALLAGGAVLVVVVGWQLFSRLGSSRLKVDPTRLTTAVVEKGQFHEYYPFDGKVEAAESVYLDVEQGGRVEQILVDGGEQVQKGQLILRFGNINAQRSAIETETRLLDSLETSRSTEFSKATSSLQRRDMLLDLDHQILDLENKYKRYDALMKTANSPISMETYETTRDQLKYLKDKREILAERIRQEEIMSANQLAQAKQSIARLTESMTLLNRTVEALEVRAPVTGYLSDITAQVGQNINSGQRIGQIDVGTGFRVRTSIDQAYKDRVSPGMTGHVTLEGKDWPVKVDRIINDIQSNVFTAYVLFADKTPPSLTRGQTVTVELSFSSPSESLIVSKGSFYQHTAGRWVYLITPDGKGAYKKDVRLGSQNPRQVQVLEGLVAGDRIIASSYDTYNDIEELRFSEALPAQQEKP
jgi:HlyD family secretion protein